MKPSAFVPACFRGRLPQDAPSQPTSARAISPPQQDAFSLNLGTPHARVSRVAANFGAPHGTPIANAQTVMHELYTALGRRQPPALIGLFVEPYHDLLHTDAAGVGVNPFGHAAVAYTHQGVTRLVNISGSSVTPMVNFMSLDDYLFGLNNFDTGNEQGGIYNRTFRLMCVWDWPAEKIAAMHAFYTQLEGRARRAEARFSQIFPRIYNLWPAKKRWGNCAMWTSQGLVEAGVLRGDTMWPKQMVVKMLERIDTNNMTCVWIPRVEHAKLTFGMGAGQCGIVAPCRTWRNCVYWDLGRQAQAKLVVPPGSMVARPVLLPDH